jgi:hypothetical protein
VAPVTKQKPRKDGRQVSRGMYVVKYGTQTLDYSEYSLILVYNGLDHYCGTKSVREKKFLNSITLVRKDVAMANVHIQSAQTYLDKRYKKEIDTMLELSEVINFFHYINFRSFTNISLFSLFIVFGLIFALQIFRSFHSL